MLNLLKVQLGAAGLGHYSPIRLVFVAVGLVAILSAVVASFSGVASFGVATFALASVFSFELLITVKNSRNDALAAALPEVAENLASAVASGQSISAALTDIANHGPKNLRASFQAFVKMDTAGYPFDNSLDWLAVELSNIYADQIIELLRVSMRSGGFGLVDRLNKLASVLRAQRVLAGELQAKQGWVTGTAKMALLAPWFVAFLLSRRTETSQFYNSAAGTSVLCLGLALCLFAYFVIVKFGQVPTPRRVFIK